MAIDCLSHCMHAAGITILCVPSPIPNPDPKPIPRPIPNPHPKHNPEPAPLGLVTLGDGFEGT
jgi:hypothetical protein